MNGRALVLAAHGSTEPGVNETLHRLARRVGRRLRFDEATAAFHRGDPELSRALDELRCDDVVVVPLLQSEGYYCDRVLPAALARNRRFPALRVRQTPPVGTHPAIGEMLARRVAELVARHTLETPAVALVAHGTPRHRGSRQAAEATARELERRTGLPSRAFFLDEEPALELVTGYSSERDLIVVPLLIGAGRHATRDLASRLGIDASGGARALILDRPFGLDPAIEEIVVDLVSSRRSPGAQARTA
ncbi:MAG TPA: CbiX/SirB N-terminal domain-containing protein [Thermoanaerobaculia bacterium]|nr:CbiX/SirB N-terminal domain-containing protein [Thermoanaerobaculia bacterium]